MTTLAARPAFAPAALDARPSTLLGRLVAMMAAARSRRCLASLDDHLLRDVGITREEARAEARRPAWDGLDAAPWDAPAHWLR